MSKTPLLPLDAVLLPGGLRPLQIVESHQLELVRRCTREQRGFVHILPHARQADVAVEATLYPIGTYVEIVDFYPMDNGLLGVLVSGRYKVRVAAVERLACGVLVADIEPLPPEASMPLPEEYKDLAQLLEILSRHPLVQQLDMAFDFDDALVVGARLSELLPFQQAEKFSLLEYQDPLARLSYLQRLLKNRPSQVLA